MGKVISVFQNGYPGTVSRQKDDVIKSFKNSGGADIPFGVPVYLNQTGGGVEQLSNTTVTTNFVGFTVRVADKTPETYPAGQFTAQQPASYKINDPVDVLVRGSMIVEIDGNCRIGTPVYVRRSDNKLVCVQGESNTTVELPGVFISRVKDAEGMAEIVISKRNLI